MEVGSGPDEISAWGAGVLEKKRGGGQTDWADRLEKKKDGVVGGV